MLVPENWFGQETVNRTFLALWWHDFFLVLDTQMIFICVKKKLFIYSCCPQICDAYGSLRHILNCFHTCIGRKYALNWFASKLMWSDSKLMLIAKLTFHPSSSSLFRQFNELPIEVIKMCDIFSWSYISVSGSEKVWFQEKIPLMYFIARLCERVTCHVYTGLSL